jgi:hypothetical protein
MVIIPFNGAIIQLSLRKMKAINGITLAAYIVSAMFILSTLYVIMFVKMNSSSTFAWTDWTILISLGFVDCFL